MGGMGGKHLLDTGSGSVTGHVQGEVNMLIFYTAGVYVPDAGAIGVH